MKTLKKSHKIKWFEQIERKHNILMIPILSCVSAVILLIALFLFYTENLKTMVEIENYRYLEEISAQINSNMKNKLNSHYNVINTLARMLQREPDKSLKAVLNILEDEKGHHNYQSIALIDSKGYIHSSKGKILYPDLIPYIAEMETNQHSVTTSVINLKQRDSVAFLSPLTNTVIEGISYKGIIAISDMRSVTEALSLTLFNNQGYAHVVTNTGAIVARSTNANNDFQGYNILTYLKHADNFEGSTVEEIKKDLQHNKSGQFSFLKKDGNEILGFYAPANYENWYLFSCIPAEILTERTSDFYTQTVIMCSLLTGIFITLIIIIIVSNKKKKRELEHILYTDPVTGGCSKLKFVMDVQNTVSNEASAFTIIFLNINKFKFLNDQIGRIQADMLLARIYSAITEELSEKEYAARLMADRFGILLNTQEIEKIQVWIEHLNLKIRTYSTEKHLPIHVSLSFGLYLLDEEDTHADIDTMLDKANMARKMNSVKDSDIAIAIYDNKMKQKLVLEQELESRQERALALGEFNMYLQPKYDPKMNTIAGAEALTRWYTKEGVIYPNLFIPIFEANGFIVKLDLFIFEEACRCIQKMKLNNIKPIPISFNLSRAWKKYDFEAELLEFEITESLIYENLGLLNETITEIHKHGFLVSMDDFGSGYSSLNMLKDVDIDIVKLDREFFIDHGSDGRKAEKIIKSVIALCKELNFTIVAEGIETEKQVQFLKDIHCDLIQGYYYSRAISKEEFMDKLQMNREDQKNED